MQVIALVSSIQSRQSTDKVEYMARVESSDREKRSKEKYGGVGV